VHHALGDTEKAVALLSDSVDILRPANNRLELARSLCALAYARAQTSPGHDEAVALAREAATIFAELGATEDQKHAEVLLARG
jgi:hypothetical protein